MPFDLSARLCVQCGVTFEPKPRGFNAKYCSDRCKRRNQRARLLADNPNQLKEARRRSYQKTKSHPDRYDKHLSSCSKYRRTSREWLSAYKLSIGCVDCGYKEHAAALQLDHEGKKSVEISEARSSIARLQREIKDGDCKVRCANCHSIRTWKNKQRDFTAGENGEIVGAGCGE